MNKTFILLILIVASPTVFANVQNANDQSLDNLDSWCESGWVSSMCEFYEKKTDSTNKISESEIDNAIEQTNSVQDLQEQLVEEDINLARERTNNLWNHILSLLELIIEVVQAIFYLAQIFIFIHIPYWYTKMLIWIRDQAEARFKK